MKRYLPVVLFALAWLALRVFWLDGDPGIAAAWEYGYNATDEGYYLVGGKEKLLWGGFVDLTRTEAFTYGFSALTHWLSYLAHLVFGLSDWAWRIPFVLISFLAWTLSCGYLVKKSGAFAGVLLSLAFSLIPLTVAYERTASNDVLIGSLAVTAYVIAAGEGRWRIFAAAALTGAIALVKPSVWVLMPIVAAGVLRRPKFQRRWLDLAAYAAAAAACVLLCRLLVVWSAVPDARRAGVTAWEIVRLTTTHYPLPGLFDFASHLRGLSAFPRDPSYILLGVAAVFVFALPVAMALRNAFSLRFNGNTLLFAAVPAYVAAVSVMNTIYTHYYIPALMFLPILVDAVAEELPQVRPDSAAWRGRPALALLAVALFSVAGGLLVAGLPLAPESVRDCYSLIYNLPPRNLWTVTWPMTALFVLVVTGILVHLRGTREARRFGAAWLISAFVAASAASAAVPAVSHATLVEIPVWIYVAPMTLSFLVASVTLVAVFGLADKVPWSRALPVTAFAAIAGGYLFTPDWRDAAEQLLSAPSHYHRSAAKDLGRLLPRDAVVIGERSNQMLMSLPVRTASTFATNGDPIPVLKSVLAADPKAKPYALVDSRHVDNLLAYRKHRDEYKLIPVKAFKMPSFDTGAPADVYLCEIMALPPAPPKEESMHQK